MEEINVDLMEAKFYQIEEKIKNLKNKVKEVSN